MNGAGRPAPRADPTTPTAREQSPEGLASRGPGQRRPVLAGAHRARHHHRDVLPAAHWRVGRHAEAVLVLEDGKSVRLPSSKTATMPGSPTRPAILPTVVALIGLALSVVLAGCGTAPTPGANPGGAAADTRPQPERTSGAAAADLVMIIRHGEKPDGSHPGVDANGHPDDSSLTATGWNRAQHLVNLLDPAQGAPRAGLARPSAIYAAAANSNGDGTRTRETVGPLADALGIPVNTSFGKGDEQALIEHVIAQPGTALICWQHGEIPAIAAAFPSVTPTPPAQWPADRFDVIWTFSEPLTAGTSPRCPSSPFLRTRPPSSRTDRAAQLRCPGHRDIGSVISVTSAGPPGWAGWTLPGANPDVAAAGSQLSEASVGPATPQMMPGRCCRLGDRGDVGECDLVGSPGCVRRLDQPDPARRPRAVRSLLAGMGGAGEVEAAGGGRPMNEPLVSAPSRVVRCRSRCRLRCGAGMVTAAARCCAR